MSFLKAPRCGFPARADQPNAKTNFPTEQSQTCEDAWFPGAHENQGRTGCHCAPARQRALEIDGERRTSRPDHEIDELAENTMSAGRESAGPVERRPFPKSSRLLKSAEFRRVYNQGTRFTNRFFSAFCLAAGDPGRPSARIGFTVPRVLGRAVKRNRIRRRVREAIRLELPRIGAQWDIVINPRRAVLDAEFDAIQVEVRKLVDRCKP